LPSNDRLPGIGVASLRPGRRQGSPLVEADARESLHSGARPAEHI